MKMNCWYYLMSFKIGLREYLAPIFSKCKMHIDWMRANLTSSVLNIDTSKQEGQDGPKSITWIFLKCLPKRVYVKQMIPRVGPFFTNLGRRPVDDVRFQISTFRQDLLKVFPYTSIIFCKTSDPGLAIFNPRAYIWTILVEVN